MDRSILANLSPSATLDLRKGLRKFFSAPEVASLIKGAIIYLDAGAGEVAHFSLDLAYWHSLGARAVFSLEEATAEDVAAAGGGDPVETVVVLTTRALSDVHRYVLRALRSLLHLGIQSVHIFTSVSEEAHGNYNGTPLSGNAFDEYEHLLMQDLQSGSQGAVDDDMIAEPQAKVRPLHPWGEDDEEGDAQAHARGKEVDQLKGVYVAVRHVPTLVCAVANRVFVLPAASTVAEAPLAHQGTLGPAFPSADRFQGAAVPGEELPRDSVALLAHLLAEMVAGMGMKPEVFGLGPVAKSVARAIVGLGPLEPMGAPYGTCALVLLDRTLDLLTPACHGGTLLDFAASCLPRRLTHPLVISSRVPLHSVPPVTHRHFDLRVDCPGGLRLSMPMPPPTRPQGSSGQGADSKGLRKVPGGFLDLTDSPGAERTAALMGGSFCQADQMRVSELVETLLSKRLKEAALLAARSLQDALTQQGLPPPSLSSSWSKSSSEGLRALATALASAPGPTTRHIGLRQLAEVVAQALDSSGAQRCEALASSERALLLGAGDGRHSLAATLLDIFAQCGDNTRSGAGGPGTTSLQEVLTLAVVGYVLAGEQEDMPMHSDDGGRSPFSWDEEYAFKEAVVKALQAGPQANPSDSTAMLETPLLSAWRRGTPATEQHSSLEGVGQDEYSDVQLKLEARDCAEGIFARLHNVARARASLPGRTRGSAYVPLVGPLVGKLVARADVLGLDHVPSGVGGFFKAGLGRLRLGQGKVRPGDQRVIIVFVIGGIAPSEVRDVKDALGALSVGEIPEVLLGGTTMLTPSDVYDCLFGTCGQGSAK